MTGGYYFEMVVSPSLTVFSKFLLFEMKIVTSNLATKMCFKFCIFKLSVSEPTKTVILNIAISNFVSPLKPEAVLNFSQAGN